MSRASLEKIPLEVSTMFDMVAPRYNRVNSLFTLGLDTRWRKKMVTTLHVGPGDKVLDLAAGTAVSTKVVRKQTHAWVVGADFSLGMLQAALPADIPLMKADAMNLPFADNSFDGVSIAFGLRNVHNPVAAIQEIYRVLKPGGRCVILESSVPSNPIIRWAVRMIGYRFTKLMGLLAGSNGAAYQYLIESVLEWPDVAVLIDIISRSGFTQVKATRLMAGAVAIHSGIKKAVSTD